MAEPKKRLTSARSGSRRSHILRKNLVLSRCDKCKALKMPHQVCPNCGFYRGIDVLKIELKAKEKEERRKAREAEEKENLPAVAGKKE